MSVTWKQVKGFDDYLVSSEGAVWSKKTKKELKPWVLNSGYKCVSLCQRGKVKRKTVHRIVAEAFIPNADKNRNDVNHKNYIRTDNRVENLEWTTRRENMNHSSNRIRLACRKKGEKPQTGERYVYDHNYGNYVVRIPYRGKMLYEGYFRSLEDAVKKRDKVVNDLGIETENL